MEGVCGCIKLRFSFLHAGLVIIVYFAVNVIESQDRPDTNQRNSLDPELFLLVICIEGLLRSVKYWGQENSITVDKHSGKRIPSITMVYTV